MGVQAGGAVAVKSYMVQLEGCRAVFVQHDQADSPEKAVEVARQLLQAPEAKHVHTEVFTGQTLSEVIRG